MAGARPPTSLGSVFHCRIRGLHPKASWCLECLRFFPAGLAPAFTQGECFPGGSEVSFHRDPRRQCYPLSLGIQGCAEHLPYLESEFCHFPAAMSTCVCMCACGYTCTYVYKYTCLHVYACVVYVCTCVISCACVHVYVCKCMYMCVRVCICHCECVYVYVCECMYVCMHCECTCVCTPIYACMCGFV